MSNEAPKFWNWLFSGSPPPILDLKAGEHSYLLYKWT